MPLKVKLKFTDFWSGKVSGLVQNNPLYRLLCKHFDVVLSDTPDFLIYDSNGYEFLKYDCIRIFYTGENRRPNFNQCDYAFSFDYPVTDRNYRLPLYRIWRGYDKLLEPRPPALPRDAQRDFCCFLASKPICIRDNFFDLLSQYKKVDAGGKLFNNIGGLLPRGSEVDWMGRYKFSIVFENASYPGYTTEKILHAFLANTIPIYWGNPLVSKDFNPNAFINCLDYDNFERVINAVKAVDQDDAKYLGMLSEPYLPGGIETFYCREKNIVKQFAAIFSSQVVHVPKKVKQNQARAYRLFKFKHAFDKKIKNHKVISSRK